MTDNVRRLFPRCNEFCIANDFLPHALQCLSGIRTDVRSHDDLWIVQVRIIRSGWLDRDRINAKRADAITLKSRNHRILINDIAAGSIDDVDAFLHLRKKVGPNEVIGRWVESCMCGNHIGLCSDRIQINIGDPYAARPLSILNGVVSKNPHPKSQAQNLRHASTYVAASDYSHGHTQEFVADKGATV